MDNRFSRFCALLAVFTLMLGLIGPRQIAQAQESSTSKPLVESQAEVTLQDLTSNKAPVYGELPAKGDVKVIVHFKDAPLSLYTGGVAGLKPTNPAANNTARLNTTNAASVAYLNYLQNKHTTFLNTVQTLSPKARQIASYRVALNGMALTVNVDTISAIRTLQDVKAIEVNTVQQLDTDSSNEFIGSPVFWDAIQTRRSERPGQGIVVGVIDSGIYNPSSSVTTTGTHPSLTDPGNGYDFPAPVGGYKGVCATTNPQPQDGSFGPCNDKLIGAWWYNAGSIANAGEMMSPMDLGGHGTHTATTAAGNEDVASPFGLLSGVAPYAQLIMYKVCWEEDPNVPDDGGCASVDSVSSIEQSIIDGVDVLNYSISGGNSPWTESVELAFLGASAAGIVVNASGGNSGPAERTVGHNGPWLTTVAASTQSRSFQGSLAITETGAPQPLEGASLYPGEVTGEIVLAPAQNANDTTPSQCLDPYAPGTFAPTDIVICRRGSIARVLKYQHAFDGGAGGSILVNSAAGQSLNADFCPKVCLHLAFEARGGSASGQALIDFLAASASPVEGTLYGGTKVQTRGDIMAGFSSRGEARVIDLIKPDVTLVGVDVAAGHTAIVWDNDFQDGQLFQVISGTSMSSPHSAGTSALMRQMFPDWTPYEIKSAMMTTSYTDTLQPDGVTPTNPFNDGAGRVDLTKVFSAGLVLDEVPANFELANPAIGGSPKTLNLASMAQNACIGVCTWTRTLRNPLGTDVTWTASSMAAQGLTITVQPASFTIPASGTQVITVSLNVGTSPIDTWVFGDAILTPDSDGVAMAHFPIAAKPALGAVPEVIRIETRRDSGGEVVGGFQSVAITDAQYQAYGLVEGMQTTQALAADSSNNSAFDDLSDGVFYTTFDVPTGTERLVADIVESTSLDIDLFVARDANNDGIPQASEVVYTSATAAVLERVDEFDPAAGTYFAVVQNWTASANAPDMTTLSVGVVPDQNLMNFDVDGPSTVPAGTPFEVTVLWDEPAMEAGDIWYGAFDVGTDAANPDNVGTVGVDIVRLPQDEVSKMVSSPTAMSGEYVTYTITITNYNSITDTFYLTDTLPDGMVIDESSITGGAVYDSVNHQLTWSGEITPGQAGYVMTDSRTGGPSIPFVDISNEPSVDDFCSFFTTCDEGRLNLTLDAANNIKFYDDLYDYVGIWTNGFMEFDNQPFVPNTDYYIAQNMPNPAVPNAVVAGLWTDLDLDGTDATDTGGGNAYVGLFTGVNPNANSVPYLITQYQNAQQYNASSSDLNFEIFARADGETSEFCTVYGTLTGNLTTFADGVSVGMENTTGTVGSTYYYNGSPAANMPAPGVTICAMESEGAPTTHVITYAAMATVSETTTFTNSVVITSDNVPGSVDTSVDVTFDVAAPTEWRIFLPVVRK